jgi:hypothetical protein
MTNQLSNDCLEFAAESLWTIDGGEPLTMCLKDYGEKYCTFSFTDGVFSGVKQYPTLRLLSFYFG